MKHEEDKPQAKGLEGQGPLSESQKGLGPAKRMFGFWSKVQGSARLQYSSMLDRALRSWRLAA